ncbi:MAG TPA: D-2-hydroxyacid dehydrogenase [Thermomicrobiales bacterium]|nr:D-2-hydroxyacid dehydrogenase [Thermomicrobiales bacterium]
MPHDQSPTARPIVTIASPLEARHVERIAAAANGRIDLRYRPDLLPQPRYVGDHGDPAWRRTPAQQAEWRAMLANADVLWDLPHGEPADLLAVAPRARWIQTTSAGVGPAVQRLGLAASDVIVTTASGIHAQPLTEFVFAALLYWTKQIPHLLAEQRAHRWERYCASELDGQTMAIVGPGRVGREVGRIARAFGMRVWAMARRNDPARAAELGVDRLFGRGELHAMLAAADCLVLATPQTPETAGLIGASEISALKPGAVVVNIARGSVLDEDALIAALRSGQVGFAALDVARVEPLPADSPLWDMPNVLISPHSASTVEGENAKLVERFVANLEHFLAGRYDRLAPQLDKQRGY